MSEKLVFIDPAVKQETDRVVSEIRRAAFHIMRMLGGHDLQEVAQDYRRVNEQADKENS